MIQRGIYNGCFPFGDTSRHKDRFY